jgi:hypothetical protein
MSRSNIAKKVALALFATSSLSSAVTFLTSITLSNVTNNEANLTGLVLDVYAIDNTQLLLKAVNNTGDSGAAIDLIYFDNVAGLFSGITFSSADSSGTVAFASGGSPDSPAGTQSGNPLAANYFSTTDIQFEAVSSANPSPPPPSISANDNRVHTGESAGFIATLVSPMGDSLDLSNFRVAYHMQSLGDEDEGSDTYLGVGPDNIPVPEPTAVTMAGLAGMLILLRRRRI